MSFPLFPEHVTVRQLDQINDNPDAPKTDTRYCRDHDFEGPVEIYKSVVFEQAFEEWRCPGIGGEDAHDVHDEIDLTDPDEDRTYTDGDDD